MFWYLVLRMESCFGLPLSDAILNPSDATLNPSDAILNPSDAILNPSDAILNPSDATLNPSLNAKFKSVITVAPH